MTSVSVAWLVGSVATVILGFALAVQFPTVGTVVALAGIASLTGFLLHVFRVATTHDDQWVWQTPGKRRREQRAEQAAEPEATSTGGERPDARA